MLTQLRNEKFMKRVMLATLIIVIPSFLFFYGYGSRDSGGRNSGVDFAKIRKNVWYKYLVKWQIVDRHEIDNARNDLFYEYAYFAYQMGKQVDPNKRDEIVPIKDAIIKAVDERIMLNYAAQKGIKVSKEELIENVKRQFGEKVTAEQFTTALQNAGMTEKEFADKANEDILIKKVATEISEQSKVSSFELWQQYLIGNEKLKIDNVVFNVKDYLDKVEINDKVLKEYYDVNAEDFRIPNQVEYEYVGIFKENITKNIKVEDSEIEDVYNKKKESDYKRINVRKTRHILAKFPPEEKPQKEAEDKINDIYNKIKNGADFDKTADEFTEDFSNTDPMKNEKKGGLLGWIEENTQTYDPEFIKVLITLKKGDVSKPFKSSFGWHIIKVDDFQDVYYTPLDEVKPAIEKEILDEKTTVEYNKLSKEFYDTAAKYTTIDSIAKALNIEKKNTGLVNKDAKTINGIGNVEIFKRDLEELAKGQTTEILESDQSLFIMQLIKEVPTYIPAFNDEALKKNLEARYRFFKANEIAKKDADDFYAKIKTPNDYEKTASEMKYEIKTSDYFTRQSNFVMGVGFINDIARDTYRLSQGAIKLSVVGQNVENPDSYIVWKLKEKQEPSKDDFNKDLTSLRSQVIGIKQKILLEEWLVDQRKGIEYDINPSVLSEPNPE